MGSSKVETILNLTASEKRELFQVLGSIDQEVKEAFGLTLTESQWNSVSDIAEAVAFQGFDPLQVIAKFWERSQAEPDKGIDMVKVGDLRIPVSIGTDAKTDLLFLLTLFLTRGNNVAKILLKCDSGIKEVISRKCSQYGISTTAKTSTTPLGPSVITLARLSQAFAPATATLIIGHSIPGNLKTRLFPGIVPPLIMTHTIFPALLRDTDTELIEIAKYLNLEMSIMLSTPKDKRRMMAMDLSELLEQSESFVMAAVNGSMMAPSIKRKTLIKAGILYEDGQLASTATIMVNTCGRLSAMHNDSYSAAIKKIEQAMNARPAPPSGEAPAPN